MTTFKSMFKTLGKVRKTSNSRRRQKSVIHQQPEALEQRLLMAGVVTGESTFDIDLFASNLQEQAGDGTGGLSVEGYSYAISQRDLSDPFGTFETRYSDSPGLNDGVSRHSWDNPSGVATSSNPFRDQEIASVSKTITAAAVLHVWQEQTASVNSLSTRLDDPIVQYLPTSDTDDPGYWNSSPAFSGITIRQLLTHTSGLRSGAATTGGISPALTGSGYIYSDLQLIAEQGTVFPNSDSALPALPSDYSYWTINYAFLRVALPYMWFDMPNSELDAAANGQPVSIDALPDGVWDMIQEDFGFDESDLDEDNMLQIGPDQLTASAYKTYVIQNILPSTITNPQTKPTNFPTLLYRFPALSLTLTNPIADQTLNVGSRGWNLSVSDIEKFLSTIRHDDSVLTSDTRDLMDQEFLGWFPSGAFVGDLGQYYGHNGVNFSAPAPANYQSQWTNNTIAMTFPEGIQASMFMNSQLGPQFGSAFDPTGNGNFHDIAMREAFDNAWTDVVYEGNEQDAGPDAFILQQDATNPTQWVELRLNGNVVLQRRIDTLDSLVINGLSGDDTLTINQLPADLELELFFNGGDGADSVTINDLPAGVDFILDGGTGDDTVNVNSKDLGSSLIVYGGSENDTVNLGTGLGTGDQDDVPGLFNYIGGAGEDDLFVNDQGDSSPELDHEGYARQYTVTETTVTRSGIGVVATFSQLEDVTVNANDQDNLITVLSTTPFTDLTLNANQGNDHIVLGTGQASSQLNSLIYVNADAGEDELVIDDGNSQFHDDELYVLHGDYFQSNRIPLVDWGDTFPPESILLQQSQVSTTTNIRNILNDVELIVEGNDGHDTIDVHESEPGSLLYVYGGGDDDLIRFTPETEDLDAIRGPVYVYGDDGDDDRVVLDDESNTDADGRNYGVTGETFDIFGAPFDQLHLPVNSLVENLEIHAGIEDDLFDIQSWSRDTLIQARGSAGSDELRLASALHTLDNIIGDLQFFADPVTFTFPIGEPSPDDDTIVIYDDNRVGFVNYDIEIGPHLQGDLSSSDFQLAYHGVEDTTLNANDTNNRVDVFGDSSLVHKGNYHLNLFGGNDSIYVQAPVSATVFGYGGDDYDRFVLRGTDGNDEVTLTGDSMDLHQAMTIPSTSVVRDDGIEYYRVEAGNGLDVMFVEGEAGLDETMIVQASTSPGTGWVSASPHPSVSFTGLEDIDVQGNAGDKDQLFFNGTEDDDVIAINPVGAGTTDEPFVEIVNDVGGSLLKLRDATNFESTVIDAQSGSDTFVVSILPTGIDYPIRSIFLLAGEDQGNQDHDQLIVDYDSNFKLTRSRGKPHKGELRFDNDSQILDIVFREFEELSVNLLV